MEVWQVPAWWTVNDGGVVLRTFRLGLTPLRLSPRRDRTGATATSSGGYDSCRTPGPLEVCLSPGDQASSRCS